MRGTVSGTGALAAGFGKDDRDRDTAAAGFGKEDRDRVTVAAGFGKDDRDRVTVAAGFGKDGGNGDRRRVTLAAGCGNDTDEGRLHTAFATTWEGGFTGSGNSGITKYQVCYRDRTQTSCSLKTTFIMMWIILHVDQAMGLRHVR